MSVTGGKTANDTRASDGGVHDGDNVAEFRLERRVEIGAALDSSEAVRICKFGEYADIVVVFELETCVQMGIINCVFELIANVRVAIMRTLKLRWDGREKHSSSALVQVVCGLTGTG